MRSNRKKQGLPPIKPRFFYVRIEDRNAGITLASALLETGEYVETGMIFRSFWESIGRMMDEAIKTYKLPTEESHHTEFPEMVVTIAPSKRR
jgi:hypothetical protein